MVSLPVTDAGYDSLPSLTSDASPTSLPTTPMTPVPPSPPLPPPMPHHLREQPSQSSQESERTSIMVQKSRSAPPNWLTTGYTLDDHIPLEPCEFRRVYYFFYGTLQDPKTLSHILERSVESSSLQSAWIVGYSCGLWGAYKALVDGPMDAVVEGVAYEVQSEEEEGRLATYETKAYEKASCCINFKGYGNGSTPQRVSGKTFRYAGDPEALRAKRFDRKLWVKNMAPEFRF